MRSLVVLAVLVSWSTAARAQMDRAAFSVERFTPPPGAGGFLVARDAQLLAEGSWSVSVWGTLMRDPLVLSDIVSGERVSAPVHLRLGYELAGAVGVTDRFELGAAMPVVAAQDGQRLQGIDLDETSLAPMALGDVRFYGTLRLTPRRSRAGLAIAARATLPTGDNQHFAGEAAPTFAWSAVAGYRARWWRLGASLGPRLRTERVVLLSPARPHGSELEALVAGEVRAPRGPPLSLLGEYAAVRGESVAPGVGVRGPSPGEARAGVRWSRVDGWNLTAGVGFGTTPAEVGSPSWRVVVGVRFDGKARTTRSGAR